MRWELEQNYKIEFKNFQSLKVKRNNKLKNYKNKG